MLRSSLLYTYFLHGRIDFFAMSNIFVVKDLLGQKLKKPSSKQLQISQSCILEKNNIKDAT